MKLKRKCNNKRLLNKINSNKKNMEFEIKYFRVKLKIKFNQKRGYKINRN